MIGTVTFNPAIDKRYYIEGISIGLVQRVKEVENTAGGKGLNLSRVAALIGESVAATGFIGGTNGQFIKEEIEKLGIENRFTKIIGQTRCCLAIIDNAGNQTEFLEPGPEVGQKDFNNWLETYKKLLEHVKILTISGSLPVGLKSDTYSDIIHLAEKKGVKVFLDTSGNPLLEGITAKPYFVKPNMDEIGIVTGKTVNTEKDIIEGIRYINKKGVKLITVSMGSEGSISYFEGSCYRAVPPDIKAVNSVGSGDAFTAGMAVAHNRGLDIIDSIKLASACGAANAMENRTGYVSPENVERIFKEVKVMKIDYDIF